MKNNIKKRTRQPVNEPVEFMEYLELLNLLPENLDHFLKDFAELSEQFQINQIELKKYRVENQKRVAEGKELLEPTPEERERILYNPSLSHVKKRYFEFYNTLLPKLKAAISDNWAEGERILNMMAVEQEALDLITSQIKLRDEFRKDFQDWKLTTYDPKLKFSYFKESQDSELSEKELYRRFCYEMKHFGPTIAKYNAAKYQLEMPTINLIFLLPHIPERLYAHRVSAGIERKGFKGFMTQLTEKDGYLDVWGQGLIAVLMKQKFTESPPVEIDRIRRCEFCNKFFYAYINKKRFCSDQCYAADYAQNKRNSTLSLLKKQLKKEKARLEKLSSRLDSDSSLVLDQLEIIKKIENQIAEEKQKNGNL